MTVSPLLSSVVSMIDKARSEGRSMAWTEIEQAHGVSFDEAQRLGCDAQHVIAVRDGYGELFPGYEALA